MMKKINILINDYKKNNKKGITLLILIVTIIVLIILAGITISTILGENGILQNIKNTENRIAQEELEKDVKISVLDYKKGKISGNVNVTMVEYLELEKEEGKYDEIIEIDAKTISIVRDGLSTQIEVDEVNMERLQPGIYNSEFALIYTWEEAISEGIVTEEEGVLSTVTGDTGLNPIVVMPSSITEISEGAFSDTDLLGLYISENVSSIESKVCSNCSNIKYLYVSRNNTTFKSKNNTVWQDNTILIGSNESIINEIGEDVYISSYAFSSRNLNNKLNLTDVVYVGEYAFYNATGERFASSELGNSEDGETYLLIEQYAFSKSSVVPANLTLNFLGNAITVSGTKKAVLENYSFEECSSLKNLVINHLNSTGNFILGTKIFYNCSSLRTVKLTGNYNCPEYGTYRSEKTFAECQNLKSFEMEGYLLRIGYSTFENDTALLTVTLPDTYNEIYPRAFYNCTSLENFEYSSTCTTILDNAFRYSGLTSIDLKNISTIDNGAFLDCKNLTTVDWTNATSGGCLDASVFNGDALKNVIIGSVTTIKTNAISASNCTVTLLADTYTFEEESTNYYTNFKVKNVICSSTLAAQTGAPWGATQLNGVEI